MNGRGNYRLIDVCTYPVTIGCIVNAKNASDERVKVHLSFFYFGIDPIGVFRCTFVF